MTKTRNSFFAEILLVDYRIDSLSIDIGLIIHFLVYVGEMAWVWHKNFTVYDVETNFATVDDQNPLLIFWWFFGGRL